VSFLFTGDAEAEVEADLTSSSYEVSATVLKVAHHGSKYSSTLDFLTAVGLEVAVISAGADNPYGHPAQETLDKLAVVGAEVYRTNLHGAIVVETDGTTYMVTTEKQPSLPPTPTEEIMISYVHYDAEGDDRYNLNDEYMVIRNEGNTAVDMTGP